RFMRSRHNLRKPDLRGGETRMHTAEDGTVTKATSKFVALHLQFHRFHQATDEDFHNHIFQSWTFPFVPYLEEVLDNGPDGKWHRSKQISPLFKSTCKDADQRHRIIVPVGRHGKLLSF